VLRSELPSLASSAQQPSQVSSHPLSPSLFLDDVAKVKRSPTILPKISLEGQKTRCDYAAGRRRSLNKKQTEEPGNTPSIAVASWGKTLHTYRFLSSPGRSGDSLIIALSLGDAFHVERLPHEKVKEGMVHRMRQIMPILALNEDGRKEGLPSISYAGRALRPQRWPNFGLADLQNYNFMSHYAFIFLWSTSAPSREMLREIERHGDVPVWYHGVPFRGRFFLPLGDIVW
jgi:hypothetical protein